MVTVPEIVDSESCPDVSHTLVRVRFRGYRFPAAERSRGDSRAFLWLVLNQMPTETHGIETQHSFFISPGASPRKNCDPDSPTFIRFGTKLGN